MAQAQSTAQEQKRQKTIDELCAFDDVLARCMFKDNIPLVELILRIVLQNPKMRVSQVRTQVDMKRVAGARSVCMDVVAYGVPPEDGAEDVINLEVENRVDRANPYRARYHSSTLDIESLKPKQDFEELPSTWVIFFVEKDIFGLHRAFYRVERMVLAENAQMPFRSFGDGTQILYVNCQYRDKTGKFADFARLAEDFLETDPEKMHFQVFADTARRFKQTEGGKKKVSKLLQELIDEAVDETVRQIAVALLRAGDSVEKVAKATRLPLEKVEALEEMLAADALSDEGDS